MKKAQRGSNMTNIKLALAATLLLWATSDAHAKTIWCSYLEVGCQTAEEKQYAVENCNALANETYKEALAEAFTDPTVWQFSGEESAQAYAEMRRRFMLALCLKQDVEQ